MSSPKTAIIILAIAVIVQAFHMVEHVAQVIQKFVLNLPAAHGVLGEFLDLEPVHFAYNTSYLILVALVFLGLRNSSAKKMGLAYALVLFTLVFQSWHFVEHSAKLYQHFAEGCASCAGILGSVVNLVILHFAYNLIVFVPMIVALLLLRKKI